MTKYFYFIIFLLVLVVCFGCENKNGRSSSPEVTKYQDAQLDSNITITPQVRADSPKVGVAGSGRATRIFVAWLDHRMGDRNVFFNYRLTTGTWAHLQDIQVDTGLFKGSFVNELDMAWSQDGNTIHLVWADHQRHKETIWYNVSRDGGQTFQTKAQVLSPNWPFNQKSTEPHIVCSTDGQIVYVVWRYATSDIVMRYSTNGGMTWSTDSATSGNPDNFFVHAVGTSSDLGRGRWIAKDISIDCSDSGQYCHIAWQGGFDYPLHRCWNNATPGWTTTQETPANPQDYIRKVQLKCTGDGNTAYVVWRDVQNNKIRIASTDVSGNFSATTSISDDNINPSAADEPFFPTLYCNRTTGDISVVWEHFESVSPATQWQVRTRALIGGAWQPAIGSLSQTISNKNAKNNRAFLLPQITGNGSDIYVTWVDNTDPTKPIIYYNSSNDGGVTWLSPTGSVLSTPGTQFTDRVGQPSIAINVDDWAYVVWSEKRGRPTPQVFGASPLAITPGDEQIPHHGLTRLHAWAPRITANGNYVYGIWLSDRFGGQDLFFNTSSDFGTNWFLDFMINQSQGEFCQNHQMLSDLRNNVYIIWEKREAAYAKSVNLAGHVQGEEIGKVLFQKFNFAPSREQLPAPRPMFSEHIQPRELENQNIKSHKPNVVAQMVQSAISSREDCQENARSIDLNNEVACVETRFFKDETGVVYFLANTKDDTITDATGNANQYVSMIRHSKDYGNTWSNSYSWGFSDYREAYIHIDGVAESEFLYRVFEIRLGTHSDIYFGRLSQYGATSQVGFSGRVDLGDNDWASMSLYPRICKDQDQDYIRLFVAWTDFRSGNNPDIYYNYTAYQLVATPTWLTTAQPLDPSSPSDNFAYGHVNVSSFNKVFYAVWSKYDPATGRFSVLFNAGDVDNTNNLILRQPIQIDSGNGNAMNPDIYSNAEQVCVTWQDTRFGTSDIMARFSLDRGSTWSEEVRFNTNDLGTGYAANATGNIAGRWAYVIWEDYRDGKNIRFEARQR